MAVVTVKVYALDTEATHDPIESVGIRVFDETGITFITSGTTDVNGLFQFDVNGGDPPVSYQLRCARIGTSFVNPEHVLVYDPLPPLTANTFNVYGNIHVLVPAADPLFCKCSGYFVDPAGRPLKDLMIRFVHIYDPVLLGSIGVATRVEIRTDKYGYAEVDLPRTGKFVAAVSGLQDEVLNILVPDRSSVSLPDLLWPRVVQVSFDPVAPWVVAAGARIEITPAVLTTAYSVLEGVAGEDVSYQMEHPEIAYVAYGPYVVYIVGVSPGTTSLLVTRADPSIKKLPDLPVTGSGGVVIVT